MFKRKHIPIYLDGVAPAIGKDKDGEEQHETVLTLRIHPFSPELAGELDQFVRSTLWTMTKVDVQEKVRSIVFDLKLPSFAMVFQAAPDASVGWEFPYARLDKGQVTAKKHKDVAGWALTFKVRVPTPDANMLAMLHAGYTRQHFITFEPAEPDLIAAMEAQPEASTHAGKRGGRKSRSSEATDVH